MHLRQLGALVSAGFEVSAIVGENILNTSSNTTTVGFKSIDSQPENNETSEAAQTKLTLSEKQRHQYQQITQTKLGFGNEGEHHSIQNDVVIYQRDSSLVDSMDIWLENFHGNKLAHSLCETTAMKPMHTSYDSQTSNPNDEGNTMAERDVGSTLLLPHTHLYKPDLLGSDISGFNSFQPPKISKR